MLPAPVPAPGLLTSLARAGLAALAAAALVAPASTQELGVELIASGFDDPVFVGAPAGDLDRLFIVEQKTCRIVILKNGVTLAEPFLDITPLCSVGHELGLLGLAFHPDYSANGRFFVLYTNHDEDTVVAEFATSGNLDVADATPVQTLLVVEQPHEHHNGGGMQFGPDGMLYLAMGDGGNGPNSGVYAQDLESPLGKILRLDVDRPAPFVPDDNPFLGEPGANPLVWAYGLRNPWRISFDRLTGDLWIADVGKHDREELNLQLASSQGGENYGWRCMEATFCTGLSSCECGQEDLVAPVFEYPHGPLGCAIIGGYVYRGTGIPSLSGTYFYSDWCTDGIYTVRYDGVNIFDFKDRTEGMTPDDGPSIDEVVSFGEDGWGSLYFIDRTGGDLFRVVAECGIANYCTSTPNSTDSAARIGGLGSPSLAQNDLTLVAASAVPESFGVFFYGSRPTMPGMSAGVSCIDPAGAMVRLDPPVAINGSGVATLSLDLLQLATVEEPLVAGQTAYFQLWFRDPGAENAPDFNYTDGLSVLFCP